MGHPKYHVDAGDILLRGESIREMPSDERSSRGLFLALQNVPEIPGIRVGEYLRNIANRKAKRKDPDAKPLSPFLFKRFITPYFERIGLAPSFLDRDLSVGFSGGEKRKLEILQADLLEPEVLVFDEVDSGLDIEATRTVGKLIQSLRNGHRSIIVITHNFALAELLPPDRVVVLQDGLVKESGDRSLIERIAQDGYFQS